MRKRSHENERRRNGLMSVDIKTFRKNQSRFPTCKLQKYNGKYVAWSPDGTQIVASDKNPEKLCKKLVARGYKPGELLVDAVLFQPRQTWEALASLRGMVHEADLRTR